MNVFVEDRRSSNAAQDSFQARRLPLRQRTSEVPRTFSTLQPMGGHPPLHELILFGQLPHDEGHIFRASLWDP